MEIVHVVAINPYRKGNKGKVFSYNIDTYDKVIGRGNQEDDSADSG
jgi:hypothetical protein